LLTALRAKKPQNRKSESSAGGKELLEIDGLKIEIQPRQMLRKDGKAVMPSFRNEAIDF
jgi:hypothetical protein